MGKLRLTSIDWLPGDSISDVFDVSCEEGTQDVQGRCLRSNELIQILGWKLHDGRFSIYDALLGFVDKEKVIRVTEKTVIYERTLADSRPLSKFVELYAGFGGMGIAARFLGGKTLVAVDWNAAATEQLRLHEIENVLQLDLSNRDNVKVIHQAVRDQRTTALMGFPCQPHSTQGRQRGFADDRAHRLSDGIWCIYMLQCEAAICECVAPAGHNEQIQAEIQELCQVMNWTFQQVELDLSMQWPAHRKRWWALLYPADWCCLPLRAWKESGKHTTLEDIMVDWHQISENDESSLRLTEFELQMYGDPKLGRDIRHLQLMHKASTLLHSYGNALGPCPCGCRAGAFSQKSLNEKGLRGYYVVPEPSKRARYLHPKEAALILGVHPDTPMVEDPRKGLCLLGLIASPLQGVWVLTNLLMNYDLAKSEMVSFTPEIALLAYKQHLLDPKVTETKYVIIERPWEKGDPNKIDVQILKARTADVRMELREAETKYKEWGHKVEVTEVPGFFDEEPDSWHVQHVQKRQKNCPTRRTNLCTRFWWQKESGCASSQGHFHVRDPSEHWHSPRSIDSDQ